VLEFLQHNNNKYFHSYDSPANFHVNESLRYHPKYMAE